MSSPSVRSPSTVPDREACPSNNNDMFSAFVCHHNSLLIYGSLKTPTIDNFSRVTHYSVGVSTAACLIMALSGFLVFGDKTLGNVLNNFPADNSFVNVARLCFGLNMLTTLPLEAFVCREVMETYFYPDAPFSLRRHVLFSTGLVGGATAISLLTCDLGAVFELVGATSAVAMAYVMPPMCYIKLTTRSWRTYLAYGVVAFGCAVMVISVIQAVDKIVHGESLPLKLSYPNNVLDETNTLSTRQGGRSAVYVKDSSFPLPSRHLYDIYLF